jgi:hypothetical protein
MKLSIALCVSVVALAAFACGGARAEPPDPCKTGCKTGLRHVTNYLNPQPLPPGIKGPGHGGNSNFVGHATGGAGTGKIR